MGSSKGTPTAAIFKRAENCLFRVCVRGVRAFFFSIPLQQNCEDSRHHFQNVEYSRVFRGCRSPPLSAQGSLPQGSQNEAPGGGPAIARRIRPFRSVLATRPAACPALPLFEQQRREDVRALALLFPIGAPYQYNVPWTLARVASA